MPAWLKADMFPFVAARPVAELALSELLREFKGIQACGAMDRSEGSQVFRWAVRAGPLDGDPCRDLARVLETPTVRHFAAVTDPASSPDACGDYAGMPVVWAAPMLFVTLA